MYCPNCGQQQVSNEMRFCSRCGLALSGLAEWLAGGQVMAARTHEAPAPPSTPLPLSPRRKNIRRAAKSMFFSAVLFPFFVMIAIAVDEPAPLIVPFFFFFASLAWMLYARLFSDPNPIANKQTAQAFHFAPTPARTPLPPASTIPISDIRGSQVRTNELAQPPSVTENTTRFLDKE